MWQWILSWFNADKLSKRYFEVRSALDEDSALFSMSKVAQDRIDAKRGEQQVRQLISTASELSRLRAQMDHDYHVWRSRSWLFDYIFGSEDDKINYQHLEHKFIDAMGRFRSQHMQAKQQVQQYVELNPERYVALLQQGSPLRAFYEAYNNFNQQNSDDALEQAEYITEIDNIKAGILSAVEGQWPAEYELEKQYAKALYMSKMEGYYHTDLEAPKEEAKHLFRTLIARNYLPAHYHYAEVLWGEGKHSEALEQYDVAAGSGSILAMRRLAHLQYHYYASILKDKPHDYPSEFGEEDFRHQVAMWISQAAYLHDDTETREHLQKINCLFKKTEARAMFEKHPERVRDVLYIKSYCRFVEKRLQEKGAEFSLKDINISERRVVRRVEATLKSYLPEAESDHSVDDAIAEHDAVDVSSDHEASSYDSDTEANDESEAKIKKSKSKRFSFFGLKRKESQNSRDAQATAKLH